METSGPRPLSPKPPLSPSSLPARANISRTTTAAWTSTTSPPPPLPPRRQRHSTPTLTIDPSPLPSTSFSPPEPIMPSSSSRNTSPAPLRSSSAPIPSSGASGSASGRQSPLSSEKEKTTQQAGYRLNSHGDISKRGKWPRFYCGQADIAPCRCIDSSCSGSCGPAMGCQCAACIELDLEEGAMINALGMLAKIVPETQKFYCGIQGVDGRCGPKEGSNCVACILLDRDTKVQAHHWDSKITSSSGEILRWEVTLSVGAGVILGFGTDAITKNRFYVVGQFTSGRFFKFVRQQQRGEVGHYTGEMSRDGSRMKGMVTVGSRQAKFKLYRGDAVDMVARVMALLPRKQRNQNSSDADVVQYKIQAEELRNRLENTQLELFQSRAQETALALELEGALSVMDVPSPKADPLLTAEEDGDLSLAAKLASISLDKSVLRGTSSIGLKKLQSGLQSALSAVRTELQSRGESNQNPLKLTAYMEVKEKLKKDKECKICMDSLATVALVPCGHLALCESCNAEVEKCPVCRAVVTARVRIFAI